MFRWGCCDNVWFRSGGLVDRVLCCTTPFLLHQLQWLLHLGVRLPRFSDELASSAFLSMPMPRVRIGFFNTFACSSCRGSASSLTHDKLYGAVFSIKKVEQRSKMNGHALCPPPLVGRGRASFFGDRSAPAVGQKAFPCDVLDAKKILENSSIILQLIKTVAGLLGLLAVPEITKRFLYPAAATVGNLHQRLKGTGRKLRSPVVKFAIKPYQEITEDRALILQGRNQEGKTTLLRETIPQHRRWGPLALEGIYLNGAKGKGVETFEKWLTTQMFGMTATGGSEIDYNLQAYRSKQWFVGFLENLGLPIAPKPAIVLVDQFEELLKRFPVQALDWANTDQPARPRQPCPGDLGLQLGCWLSDLAQFEPRHSLWQGHHGAGVWARCDRLGQGVVPEV